MPHGLPRRLRYVFILQAVMASFAIVIGFYFVGMFVKDALIGDRVQDEAQRYWAMLERHPEFPLPRNAAASGYFIAKGAAQNSQDLPAEFIPLEPGLHDLPGKVKLLIEERPAGRLYVSMSFPLVERVVFWAGLVAIAMSLLAIVAVSWLTYRSARRLVAPVNWLAREVSAWDPREPDTDAIDARHMPGHPGHEVQQLGSALRDMAERTRQHVQREREFTRDASHELRTPLTVIRVATDMMRSDPDTPQRMQRTLLRVRGAGQDMEAVIDAFLILAREADTAPQLDEFDACEVVWEAADKARPLLDGKPVELEVVCDASPRLLAWTRVLSVMLDNILGNACTFTDEGRIEIRVAADHVVVRDTGVGMSPETLQRAYDPFYRVDQFNPRGKGMGLAIVRRLGERFDWPVTLESIPGEGTTATIGFAAHLAG